MKIFFVQFLCVFLPPLFISFYFIFLIFIFTLFYFTILYWFCHTSRIHHGCTWVPKHEPPVPPPTPYHLSGSSLCTSPKHPVSCIEHRLVIHFLHDSIHVSMPFSQIIPPSPSPSESKSLLYTSVSLLLSCIQGYHYHLSKSHIYALVYCIGEGNGSPLQCSCLKNPRDGGTSWAAVYGVAQSQTWLKQLSSSSSSNFIKL